MEKKSNTGLILAIVICAVLAVGGIGYGAWATVSGNSQNDSLRKQVNDLKQQVNDLAGEEVYNETDATIVDNNETVVIAEKTIDNYLAQSLIGPYIKSFNHISNIFDYDFNDDAKINIAYLNGECDSFDANDTWEHIQYWCINEEYKVLFGDGTDLAKRDYSAGHTNSFVYEDNDLFKVKIFNGGGAGGGDYSVVKDANMEDNRVLVRVYHDQAPICEATDDDYCVETGKNSGGFHVESIEEYNLKELIEKFSDRIPVYKMTFTKNNGHYVLSAVEKES